MCLQYMCIPWYQGYVAIDNKEVYAYNEHDDENNKHIGICQLFYLSKVLNRDLSKFSTVKISCHTAVNASDFVYST